LKLIVGLGNPGSKYLLTRHNLGFMVLDELAEIHRIDVTKKKFGALVGEGVLAGVSIVLVKPQTFMNLSGTAVRELFVFYKPEPKDLLVIHDDLDLEPGVVRIKLGGGAGGHRGLKSIIDCLGCPDFVRIRLGIGKPALKDRTESYVLERFAAGELEQTAAFVLRGCDAVEEILRSGLVPAMNRFNPRSRKTAEEFGDGDAE
jgi:peptidyl-tRNA hydrolase, PTH1 family